MNPPVVAIEMAFGTNEVDSATFRLAGDPAGDPQQEAFRLLARALYLLGASAPDSWTLFRDKLPQAGRNLLVDGYLDAD